MRMALVAGDGTVANVALVADGAEPPQVDGHSWASAPSHVGPGWRIIGGEWQPPAAPAPTADDVRAEAQRRIIAQVGAVDLTSCLIKQLNASMRATELVNKKASGIALTDAENVEAAALQALADQIKAIRAASNAMEGNPPADYRDASRWPS